MKIKESKIKNKNKLKIENKLKKGTYVDKVAWTADTTIFKKSD
jgi:hypothetical protein